MMAKCMSMLVFIIVLLGGQVSSIGMIFSGEDPLIMIGVAGEENELDGNFKIGSSEMSTEDMVFSFIFLTNKSFLEAWNVSLLSPNNTIIRPGEITDVKIRCRSK